MTKWNIVSYRKEDTIKMKKLANGAKRVPVPVRDWQYLKGGKRTPRWLYRVEYVDMNKYKANGELRTE